ncbi:MAG TPA: hypothetical protein VF614_17255 [Chthoniobacteraceae bacterium]|jgi:disulfide bond formation protein DsbB
MPSEVLLFFRLLAASLFVLTAFAGIYLARNYQRLFGVDPSMPSETGSSRAYSKVQIFAIWAHVLFATGAFALLLH